MDSGNSKNLSHKETKKGNLKDRIEQYYKMLLQGCGNSNCLNENCFSSSNFMHVQINSNSAAVLALKLCKNKAKLCCQFQEKTIQRELNILGSQYLTDTDHFSLLKDLPLLIQNCQSYGSFSSLNGAIYYLFSQRDKLLQYFSKSDKTLTFITEFIENKSNKIIKPSEMELESNESNKYVDQHSRASSVDISSIEVYDSEAGTSVDAQEITSNSYLNQSNFDEIYVDLEKLDNFYKLLLSIDDHPFLNAFSNALLILARDLYTDFRGKSSIFKDWLQLNMVSLIIIIMKFPLLDSIELVDKAVPAFYKLFRYIPINIQSSLVKYWSKFCPDDLRNLVRAVQQCITLQIVLGDWSLDNFINKDLSITGAVVLLRLLFYANILGGTFDEITSVNLPFKIDDSIFKIKTPKILNGSNKLDELQKVLNLNPIQSRHSIIHRNEFVNESLSNAIEIEHDFTLYKSQDPTLDTEDLYFSFLMYPFVLTALVKSKALFFDNRITMLDERRRDFMLSFLAPNSFNSPYLKLHIRRDHIIDDALVNLEFVAAESPQDLRKQLFVEFEGEQAVDEGGVSKEFFQILVDQLFNPDFGMFIYNEETHCFWFNENSLENESQFVLIGILLGLAIYNNVILNIRLPPVVYSKLFNKKASFDDLKLISPMVYKNLNELLIYMGDVEKDMALSFSIDVADMFGNLHTYDLIPNGRNLSVNNQNRQEYVDLYSDYLLNKSIEQQFSAFKKGFDMVTSESPLTEFFSPDEIELLVCGSENLNFIELEESTEYDGGFSNNSTTIKNFWEIVHKMDDNDKRRLLQFVTGSDRVPIGGLAKLKLVITKNGTDSNRLPTAHTCFNVLMLPDYSSKEKLKERLLKSIDYSKGFGLL